MAQRADFDKIEIYLIRVLHTVITERNVSRAALKLGSSQPALSAQLRRLRELTGDPLLVRSGNGLAPTPVALELLAPAAELLQQAQTLFGSGTRSRGFEPAASRQVFRIAASDYLDPLFLPELVARVRALAPNVTIEILPLSREFDYRQGLARGEVDLVIGNWLQPPAELHLGRLLADEVVCLVAADHPAVKNPRGWTAERYLQSDHVAPTGLHAGALGVIDEHLALQGLQRRIAVRSPHFGLVPLMVARTQLVLTTGRLFCSRYVDQFAVRIVRCPVAFPALVYYQLWHELKHQSAAVRWLREQVRELARSLPNGSN
ncbi:LysR family transcriptional regulator [Rivibacter subsaxonicus]|uniref:DNA-binding transcriptional LysR family regulator n=1 Tax=Rivibacter subsaxonicus TaxID=457575 RepID=A0A4Q7VZY9_9BURK|nr:LysR family transcriptional regulator [Rivibacter subsaxonicus]RZU02447.1 DNA-binding transcriptional LysR family regulator [Rivibacter subsaxonicus]